MKRLRNLMIILMSFLSVGVIGIKHANASDTYSEAFKELTSGTLTLTNSGYEITTNYNLVQTHIMNFNDENATNFEFLGCDDEVTTCSIGLWVDEEYERHDVAIVYQDVYSTTFQKLTNNGTAIVPFMNRVEKETVLMEYLATLNADDYSFQYHYCNDDYTICEVSLSGTNGYYELHKVNITYQEVWSDEFKAMFPNNTFTITSSGYTDKQAIISNHLIALSTDTNNIYISSCREDDSKCIIGLSNNETLINEEHEVNVVFEEKYGTEFKKLTTGDLVIEHTYNSGNLLDNYIADFNIKNNTNFEVFECNEDSSVCTIILYDEEYRFVEQHKVNITYKETLSQEFEKFSPNKKITITNSDLDDNMNLISTYVYNYNSKNNTGFYLVNCNDERTLCHVGVWLEDGYEEHEINVTYKEQYGEIFQKLTKDGNIVVNGSTLDDKNMLVDMFVRSYSTDKYNFSGYNCNDTLTKCVVILNEVEQTEHGTMTSEIERHVVNVSFKESFSSDYQKLTNNNELIVESISPTTDAEAEFFLSTYISSFNTKEIEFYPHGCNDDYTMCDVAMYKGEGGEIHTLKITYKEVNKDIQNKVMAIINSLPKGKRFLIEDLEMINYIVNGGYDLYNFDINVENAAINYSTELKQLLGNGNITAKLDLRAGGASPFESHAFGGFLVLYDGVAYGLLNEGGVQKRHVIYIPDNTKDTTEAYIKAAETRINSYLKNKTVKITYAGKSSDLDDTFLPELITSGKRKDEYYILTYEDREFEFLIVKDSSKMQTLESHATSDIFTDVTIKMDASNVPLDTTIKVDEIEKNTEKYKELISKLNLDEALIYDLKLFSSSIGEYIKQLEDGSFEVSIPIPENLKGKELIAYYLNEDGTREEYKITIKDGKAIFNTKHFSVYTIAEPVEVPNTYDGVTSYIILGLVSLISLVGLALSLKNKKNN